MPAPVFGAIIRVMIMGTARSAGAQGARLAASQVPRAAAGASTGANITASTRSFDAVMLNLVDVDVCSASSIHLWFRRKLRFYRVLRYPWTLKLIQGDERAYSAPNIHSYVDSATAG